MNTHIPRHATQEEALNETDISAFDMTVAIFKQKVMPFIESHRYCPPSRCPHFSEETLNDCRQIIMRLQFLIDGFNEARKAAGLPPLASWQNTKLPEETKGKIDA